MVKDGLDATDRVIVNGLMRARPGVKVAVEDKDAPTSAARKDTNQAKAD